MTRQFYGSFSVLVLSIALSGCATTGGFEPARIATKSFSDGATAGKTFVETRNAALLDASRLSRMQWHTAKTSENDTTRLLQPDDKLNEDPAEMQRLVKGIVCDGGLLTDEGTLLIQLSQNAAKSLKAFDFKESDSSISTLKLLSERPAPAAISLSTTPDKNKAETAQKNRNDLCESDFDDAINQAEKAQPGGGTESVGSIVAAGTTAYSALKELDKKLAGVLGTVVDIKRRAEFNDFVKTNKSSFTELRDKLRKYADEADKGEENAIRKAAMTKYIFAFDDFAGAIVKRKPNPSGTLFAMDIADLSEDKKAKAVIDAANSYNSAVNSGPAKPIRELAGSIDDLLALTDPPDHKDLYKQYESGKAFYEALGELADATQDEELKKALSDLFNQL